MSTRLLISLLCATLSIFVARSPAVQAQTISLDALDQLKLVNVKAEKVTFKGRKALRVSDPAAAGTGDEEQLLILSKTDFQDGIIEVDLAGALGREDKSRNAQQQRNAQRCARANGATEAAAQTAYPIRHLPVLLVQQRNKSSQTSDQHRNPCRHDRREEFRLAHVLRDLRQDE